MTDRDVKYMKEMWGTTSLITDYPITKKSEKKLLREVTTDEYGNKSCDEQNDLHAPKDDSWNYGIEPTYMIN